MSEKTKDKKNRWRNKTVAFRTSPEEAKQLDLLASLCGMNKQDFLIGVLLDPEFTVTATVRMRKAVRESIAPVVSELRRIRRAGDIPDELIESVETIALFVGSFADEESPVDSEDALIKSMKRSGGTTRQSHAAAPDRHSLQ